MVFLEFETFWNYEREGTPYRNRDHEGITMIQSEGVVM